MSDEEDQHVGYGRPPVRNQFKKSLSGNPKGRPKGAKNFATALSAELNGRIAVSENGKRRKISRREVIAKQLVNRAVTGDHKALPILFNETRALETAPPAPAAVSVVRQEDQAVMKGILDRLRAADEAQRACATPQTPSSDSAASAAPEDPTQPVRDSQEGKPDAEL
jgi:hypothetical protein